jgi:hypothetical protein
VVLYIVCYKWYDNNLISLYILFEMRVLSRLRTHQNHNTAYQDTHVNIALEQVHSVVHTILMGTTDAIRSQEEQIRRILARIPAESMQFRFRSNLNK